MKNLDPADLAVRLATSRALVRILLRNVQRRIGFPAIHEFLGEVVSDFRGQQKHINGLVNRNTIGKELGDLGLTDSLEAIEREARHVLPEIFESK